MTTETKTIIGVTLVCLAILFGGAYLYQSSIPQDTLTGNQEALVREDSKMAGATTTPKVTVVEFGDYQCPACAAVAPRFMELKEMYGDEVAFVFRDYPLPMHRNAMIAAVMTYIADEQGKYWEMHEKLYASQAEWQSVSDPSDLFVSYAAGLGMNTAGIKEKLLTDIYQDRIKRDVQDGNALGVNSTPTFFIGDVIIRTANHVAIKAAIDAALAK